ncbi:MAG: hypothetical protein IKE05_01835, partial [Clostridia bacterium]|nr:hypothetical protein [Clostridia bacterium]
TDTYEIKVTEKHREEEEKTTPTPKDTSAYYEWGGKTGNISVPDTGDHSNTALWIFMMSISSIGLLLSSSWFERRKRFFRR